MAIQINVFRLSIIGEGYKVEMFFTIVPKYFLLIHAPGKKEWVLPPRDAFLMTRLLQGVVEYGTDQRARALGRPVAGKTGTSSGFADAWFIGYIPSLLTSVWVGFDDKTSLGENEMGGRAALPIWVSFVRQALRNKRVGDFKAPDGIAFVKASIESGQTVSDEVFAAAAPSKE
jgi:penicillin-binding protein 1A